MTNAFGDETMAKSKYITHYCAYCHKETKMELVGGMNSEGAANDPARMWFRCARCKHSALIDRSMGQNQSSMRKLERDEAIEYAASKIFIVGQTIYHSEWDDLGRVTSKIKTSGGVQAITVSFEKLGERKLIENLAADAL